MRVREKVSSTMYELITEAEHTEQNRAEDLEDGGEDAGGSQGEHLRSHRCCKVVCNVIRAYPDCKDEGNDEREHQHPYVLKWHLHQPPETDKLIRQVGAHDGCESLWSLNAIEVFSTHDQILLSLPQKWFN